MLKAKIRSVFHHRALWAVALAAALLAVMFTVVWALSIGTYDQCSNDLGTGYTAGDLGCRWINGNLQHNNSTYTEGDATVQRVWLTDFVPGSTHSITLKYGTTKGGTHAYDFLTTWDWSEDWILLDDRCQDITGCTTASEDTLDIPQDPNVPDAFEPSAPGDRQFVMRGGTLLSATTPVVVSGNYVGDPNWGGDSETIIIVTFQVDSSGAMCPTKGGVTTCDVALWFGAHVAMTAQWTPVDGRSGAGGISGSPYHVALDQVDGASVGQRDNQMQSEAIIPNGTIIIIKDATPKDGFDFWFNLNGGVSFTETFGLDNDGVPVNPPPGYPVAGTYPVSRTFSLPQGAYTAAELYRDTNESLWAWLFTNLICVDPTANTTVNLLTATANIALASGETVVCTFYNEQGTLAVELESLSATAEGANATVAWQTVSERDVKGFNVYRAASPGGAWTKLNANMIPAKAPGSLGAGSYAWADAGLSAGATYFYQLESISLSDVTKLHEPVSVTIAGPTAVQLSSLSAVATAWPFAAAGLAALGGLALARLKRR